MGLRREKADAATSAAPLQAPVQNANQHATDQRPVNQSDTQISALRNSHYNAAVTRIRRVHDELMVVQVRPDGGPLRYEPGQYTVLGLGHWEPRLAATQQEVLVEKEQQALARRAYSISSPLLDEQGRLARPGSEPELEFYVALVRRTLHQPPALTPRLFLLQEGDRIYIGPRAHGHYTLAPVEPEDDVVFAATGTGEAPHNAMIAELLSRGHRGLIASVVCVRYRKDLAYLTQHRELEKRYSNYRYVAMTTREAENLDPTNRHYVGKLYIQGFFRSDDFASRTRMSLNPEKTHVYLCGNPDMIGAPPRSHGTAPSRPILGGMVELLESRGFSTDLPGQLGNIHLESYW